ncbi:MAG TPA: hypothetical protein VEL07_23515 [Planctomycetota bacterium]|nr:hypothetical protein [Planctomycetota bacterium]
MTAAQPIRVALSDDDRALLAEAARVAAEPADGESAEAARLNRYLALERALSRRGEALATRADEAFVSRVMGALPPEAEPAPATDSPLSAALMRLTGLPAALVIVASFHQSFEWHHWLAAAALAVAPLSLVLHGLARQAVRTRDLVYGGAVIASLALTILALAQAVDSDLAQIAGWTCLVLGTVVLGATWATRLVAPTLLRRLSPVELFVAHQVGVIAFIGGSCLVLHS